MLLSVVVPTKDRYECLEKLVELIAGFKTEDIELVIQDNSEDNSAFLEYMARRDCSFIRYAYIKGQIPMSTNSDKAILNSRGEYVCFIGDDDGVTKYVIECARWMKRNEVDAVLPSSVSYNWPDCKGSNHFDLSSSLLIPKKRGDRLLSPSSEFHKLARRGFIDRGRLPLVYHGIVARATLDKIYEIGGTYFPASSPDISNGVALSFLVGKFAYLDCPTVISGASRHHGGGAALVKKKYADLSDIRWLLPDAEEKWEDCLPKIGVGLSIWPDSAIKAIRYMGKEECIKEVNFTKLYSLFISQHYDIRQMVLTKTDRKFLVYLGATVCIINRYMTALKNVATIRFNRFAGYKVVKNLPDIEAAAEYLHSNYAFSAKDAI